MGAARLIFNIFLFLIIILLSSALYFIIIGKEPINLNIANYTSIYPVINVSEEVLQFYPNMRFNHNNLTYYISPDCSQEKMLRVKNAFFIIQNLTILTFKQQLTDSDILISCSPENPGERNIFVAGEGGPTAIINSTIYPLILKGKIILYEDSKCPDPVVELHEALHVLGFDHISDKNDVLYPYVECNQKINEKVVYILNQLYSMPALPELYFKNITASKKGIYLDFVLTVENIGLTPSKNLTLTLSSNDRVIRDFELSNLGTGSSVDFSVSNLNVGIVNEITFTISSKDDEYYIDNNVIKLKI